MKIAVIGAGYVGKAMIRFFGERIANVYDPYIAKEYQEELEAKGIAVNDDTKARDCDLAVVSVPTLTEEDGSCNTSIVEEVVGWIESPLILIKSTIEPGTTEKLVAKTKKNIAFSPEYIGEGHYFTPPWKYPDPTEMKMHTFQIFGGERSVTSKIVDIFQRIMGPHVFYAQTDSRTAELVKYMENAWGAMKVTWANEWFEICQTHERDYREVRELWALDSRVEKMHTCVFPEARGFGGKCFPKDNKAILASCRKRGLEPKLLAKILEVNEDFRAKNDQQN